MKSPFFLRSMNLDRVQLNFCDSCIIIFRLTSDDQVGAGANLFDPQISSDLTLVLAIIGQRCIGDLQIVNTGGLITDQLQPRMAHDFAVCNN